MKIQKQKEFDEYINEQFRILKGHFERCMLRCFNKLVELDFESYGSENA